MPRFEVMIRKRVSHTMNIKFLDFLGILHLLNFCQHKAKFSKYLLLTSLWSVHAIKWNVGQLTKSRSARLTNTLSK